MVEFATPKLTATARAAGQVSDAPSRILAEAAGAAGKVADGFTRYYEEKAGIENERILFKVQEDAQRSFNEAVDSKSVGNGFSKSFITGHDERVAKYMEAAPERGRDNLDLALEKYRSQLETRALKAEAAARAAAAAKAKAEANKAAAEAKRLRGNAIISDPSTLADAVAEDPDNADYYSKIHLSARIMDDPVAIEQEVMAGNWDANLSPSDKLAFIKQGRAGAERMQREEEALLSIERKSYEAALDEELSYAAANGTTPVDSVYDEDRIAELYTDPEARAEVKRVYTEGVAVSEMVYGVSVASYDDIADQAATLRAAVSEPGHTDEDVANLNRFGAALNQRNKAIETDAAGFVASSSDVVGDTYKIYAASEPDGKDIAARNYATALDGEYERMGVPEQFRTLLPKTEAERVATGFNQMAPDVVAMGLVQYMAEWGDAAPRVMAELAAADLAPEYAVAMRHWDNPGLSAEIVGLRGVAEKDLSEGMTSDVLKIMGDTVDGSLGDFRAAFEAGDVGGSATQTFNQNYNVARRLALKYMRNGEDAATAGQSAIDKLFPEVAINEANAQVIVPVGADDREVRDKMDRLREVDALREFAPLPLDDPRLPEFADLEVLLNSAEDSGVWLNNSTGDGAVLHLNINGYLLPIINKDGKEYGFKFTDPGSW